MPVVRMVDIKKNFGEVEVLKGINFELEKGQIVAILGPSGSGKSTLLRCLNHLEQINQGAVEVDGVVVGTAPGAFQIRPGVHEVRVTKEGYATWEKSVAFADGQTLDVPIELSAAGLARKGELESQAIAREQSAADAQATTTVAGGIGAQASNSFIRLEGMPNESLTIGDTDQGGQDSINVIQQKQE